MKKLIFISSLILNLAYFGLTVSYATYNPIQYHSDDTIKNPKRGEPIADFDIQPSKNVCVGDTVYFINKSQNNIFSYWEFGDGDYTYKTSPSHIYFAPQLYRIRLLVKSDDNDSMFLDDYLLVNAIPSVRIDPSGTAKIKQQQELTVQVTDAFEKYEWFDQEGNLIHSGPTLTLTSDYTKTLLGEVIFEVWVTDPIGCKNFATLTLNVERNIIDAENPDEVIVENNIITPNGDGYNDYLTVKELEAYLHPCTIKIYNVWGDIVYDADNYANQWDGTETKTLDAGTYYYVIESKGRKGAIGFVDIIR